MNILMFTNTYLPHVGGVARSIHSFVEELRNRGHDVRVVAPFFRGRTDDEPYVFRVPAIIDFNRSGFSVPLPFPGHVSRAVDCFIPDIIHSHHPFLLGNTALRYAAFFQAPAVFTHHTLYEQYTHYIPGDSLYMKRFIVNLATSYCNLCDAVIAPSTSLQTMLYHRGVRSPSRVLPTGVNPGPYLKGDGESFRKRFRIPEDAFVIGHVGRLAREKNLELLTLDLSHYLRANPDDHVLFAGVGPMEDFIRGIFDHHGLQRQLHMAGVLDEQELPSAYHAMNVFAFSSQSETQGIVLIEAMASGVPVIALDGPGVRDVLVDRVNGRLIRSTDVMDFVKALLWVKSLGESKYNELAKASRETASGFTVERSTDSLVSLYESLLSSFAPMKKNFRDYAGMLRVHGNIMQNFTSAAIHAAAPASRELFSCGENYPDDPELQSLLAQHAAIRARIAGYIISLFIRLQKKTWRKYEEGKSIVEHHMGGGEPMLFSFWHGKYLPLFAILEGLHGVIFASCSFRGQVIAEVCRRFGYECILIPEHARKRAVEIMAKAILHYGTGAVAADGPRGPRRIFKLGSVQLASELGMTVVPASVAVYPKIVSAKRWDLYESPLPFSYVYFLAGKGIKVPVGLKAQELESWSRKLKRSLDDVDHEAEERLTHIRASGAIPSLLRSFVKLISFNRKLSSERHPGHGMNGRIGIPVPGRPVNHGQAFETRE